MTEPLSPEARLAALLHVEIRDKGWASCVHSPEGEWLPFCAEIAARLIAAGVTLDAARQPAPEAARADWSVAPGEVLREWFTERGITQSKVAARMGVSSPEVSKLVNGHDRITPRMALALERACGINADVLARMQTDHDLRALRAATPEDPR